MPRTLWDRFKERVAGPVENEHYNPAGFKIHGRVVLDILDYRDHNWAVEHLIAYTYRSGRVDLRHTDYVLHETAQNGRTIRLRAIPQPQARGNEPNYALVLLGLYHEQAYDPGLETTLKDTDRTGVFECFTDGKLDATYHRIGGAKGPYSCRTVTVNDLDGNGRAERDEQENGHAQYYDFWRDTKDEGGTPLKEYLFAEIRAGKEHGRDVGDGWITIWTGPTLDLAHIVEM